MEGKRVYSHDEFWEAGPGAYLKIKLDNEWGWLVTCPNGHHAHIGRLSWTPHHVVEENDDSTITVRPNPPAEPSNSNSILCTECGWHGYIYAGHWQSV